jgi:hypothetical protein
LWATNFGKRKKKKKEAFNENNLIIAKMVKGIIITISWADLHAEKI